MKLIFLGAGSSMPADYPAASNLLATLETHINKDRSDVLLYADWQRFLNLKKCATGIAKKILNSTNPEVMLSLLDLYATTLGAKDQDWWNDLSRYWKNRDTEALNRMERNTDDLYSKEMKKGKAGIFALLSCIDGYFGWRHYFDSKPEAIQNREYLKKELSSLSKGDVVITTNWDTLVERILAEERRWTPADGYGFRVHLKRDGTDPILPKGIVTESEVKILKLHGSLGWRYNSDDTIYFPFNKYLKSLPLPANKEPVFVRDLAEPKGTHQYDPLVVIYPSYIKHLKGEQMQRIWFQAGNAVSKAEEIRIIGYSLPESDFAVRTLLNPLRFRSQKKDVKIFVDDPDPKTRKRWRDFLGDSALIRDRCLTNTYAH